ncbi:UNVERIFIED_CONTAM: hypothetical protein FKN15_045264 [Acipenser sinensis]
MEGVLVPNPVQSQSRSPAHRSPQEWKESWSLIQSNHNQETQPMGLPSGASSKGAPRGGGGGGYYYYYYYYYGQQCGVVVRALDLTGGS